MPLTQRYSSWMGSASYFIPQNLQKDQELESRSVWVRNAKVCRQTRNLNLSACVTQHTQSVNAIVMTELAPLTQPAESRVLTPPSALGCPCIQPSGLGSHLTPLRMEVPGFSLSVPGTAPSVQIQRAVEQEQLIRRWKEV